jgi:hypothetical protein
MCSKTRLISVIYIKQRDFRAKCLLDVDSQQAKLLGSEVKSIPVFPMMPRGARKY